MTLSVAILFIQMRSKHASCNVFSYFVSSNMEPSLSVIHTTQFLFPMSTAIYIVIIFFSFYYFFCYSHFHLFFIVILLLSVTNQPARKLQTSIRARNRSHIQQLTQIPLQQKRPYRRKVTHNKGFASWIRE